MTKHYLHEGHLALGTFPDSGDQQGNESLPVHPDGLDGSQPCPPSTPDLPTAVAVLTAASEMVNAAAMGAIDGLAWKEAATLLRELRATVTNHIGPLDASLVRHLYMKAPHGQTEVEGLGVIEVRRTQDRKNWSERGAVFDYVGAKIQENGGEMPDPETVAEWVLEIAGIGYIRVTPLRAARLDPEDYCTSEPGKPTVTFR